MLRGTYFGREDADPQSTVLRLRVVAHIGCELWAGRRRASREPGGSYALSIFFSIRRDRELQVLRELNTRQCGFLVALVAVSGPCRSPAGNLAVPNVCRANLAEAVAVRRRCK